MYKIVEMFSPLIVTFPFIKEKQKHYRNRTYPIQVVFNDDDNDGNYINPILNLFTQFVRSEEENGKIIPRNTLG